MELETCVTCGGTGVVHSHNPECWTCDGSGTTTPEKNERELVRLRPVKGCGCAVCAAREGV